MSIQLIAVLFEGIGLSAVLPVLQFIEHGGNFDVLTNSGPHWKYLIKAAEILDVSIDLPLLLIAVFTLILLRQLCIYARDVYSASVQLRIISHVRNKAFDGFLFADLDYHDEARSGQLVNELTTELLNAAASISTGIKFIGHLLTSGIYCAIVFALSSYLTVLAFVILLCVAVILLRVMRKIHSLGYLVTQANQEMSTFLVERIKSIRLVRLSNIEEAERQALQSFTERQRKSLFEQRKMLALLGVLIEPIVLAIALILIYFAVTELGLELTSILLFSFILLRLAPIVKEAIIHRQSYMAQVASAEVLIERLSYLEKSKEDTGGPINLIELTDGIKFSDLQFRYASASANALNGLSFEIPAGKMTALVGPSGAGKSTIVDCLPRLRKPSSGQILFDGIPQQEISARSLRQAIAFVPQHPQIFNVTVAEHIRYGYPDATDEAVYLAARLAQAEEFIGHMEHGYDTMLGEGGIHLSGGQRQRLDLARALVKQAPILVLDEPTSNLDPESEEKFLFALETVRRETMTTLIVIAHKPTTIRLADRIAVIENGVLAALGTHHELVANNSWYQLAYRDRDYDKTSG